MTLKTALVAPMPRASERTAVRANPGRLRSSRAAKCRSLIRDCITVAPQTLAGLDEAIRKRLVLVARRWSDEIGLGEVQKEFEGQLPLQRRDAGSKRRMPVTVSRGSEEASALHRGRRSV